MNTYGWALIDHDINAPRLVHAIFLDLDDVYEYLESFELLDDFKNTSLEVKKIDVNVELEKLTMQDREVRDESSCSRSGYDYSKIITEAIDETNQLGH